MNQYAFIDWELVHSTPMQHTYSCGWRDVLRGRKAPCGTGWGMRRRITLEWDGQDHLMVRTGRVWPSRARWTNQQLTRIVFGLRELAPDDRSAANEAGWLWFIQLTGKAIGSHHGVLAEFLVAQQQEAPASSRASVPARVQELLNWLGNCMARPVHGPILITDKESRQRILSHVD